MPFRDFSELSEPLRLPYRGKVYEIAPVGLLDAPILWEALERPEESTLSGQDFRRMLLGATWDQLVADNVPLEMAVRAEMTALADFRAGRETAEYMWETGSDPKVLAAWAASRTLESPNSATDAGTSTPTPASTPGTRTSPTVPAEAPAPSSGASSSTSGRSSKPRSSRSTGSTSKTRAAAARGGGSASA